ncbi:MAG: carboxylating nicotinate-nucleotide diphosphorylase [Vampirovibrionales bacterium]|nr:carboxylating nicotinate-nucleotide diphosphorylase [Vampirovibrionales bacterium]
MSLTAQDSWIDAILAEDLAWGDCTVTGLGGLPQFGTATLNTREDLVASGIDVTAELFKRVDQTLTIVPHAHNGDSITTGQCIMTITGPVGSLLMAERAALNTLQHLCAVATHTQRFVKAMNNCGCKLLDTRKTTPGLRMLEKTAVVHGGGHNHRMHLGDAAMLKDNHWAAMEISIEEAVTRLRQSLSASQKLTVECDTLEQLSQLLALPETIRPDNVLLDNMSLEQLRQAVAMINALPAGEQRPTTEASGGVTLETIGAIAQTGVDHISTSQITVGAPPVDIGMELTLGVN